MLFLYLDESGNYTFSKEGSEYLIYSSFATSNPFAIYDRLCNLEENLKRQGITLEKDYFHASEDKQIVRNEVYNVLKGISGYDIDCVFVEKRKTNPALRNLPKLYKKVYKILLQYVLTRYPDVNKILVFIHEAPEQKKREALKKGIKETFSELFQNGQEKRYYLLYVPSVFSYGLQAADYCCWAVKKLLGDWGRYQDQRPYQEISHFIRSKFDLFERGTTIYY
ncbi:MAG: DUF3800 domain-containing protein [Candidatus Omnitrophota bacterium]|nr:DUF3800 domain-containing protein [Candidatus Omnitrophota bacterium]